MNNKTTLVFLLALIVSGCSFSDIDRCEVESLPYSELPEAVKETILDTSYMELNQPQRYRFYLEDHAFMPWVKEEKLERLEDGKVFDLDYDLPHASRAIILGDYLYVPQGYNHIKSDSLRFSFSRFDLK